MNIKELIRKVLRLVSESVLAQGVIAIIAMLLLYILTRVTP